MPGSRARFAASALLVALALPLAGCETTSDPVAAVVTSPGQYDLYDCPEIKTAAIGVTTRQRELEGLMVRADRGLAGGLISATTYKPEYLTLRGKMSQLRSAAAEKHCNFDPATVRAARPQPSPRRQPLPPPKKRPDRAEYR